MRLTFKKHLRWLPYGLIATLAIGGQYLAGVEHLHPTTPVEHAAIIAVAIGIEAIAVWLSVLARERARRGENARLYWVISTLFAGLAAAINIIGHNELYLAAVFGGFSAAGFVIWLSEQIDAVKHAWDADGSIRAKVPAYAHLRQFESDEKIVKRARLLAHMHAEQHPDQPGMGIMTALETAREQLAVEDRRRRLIAVVAKRYKEAGFSADEIDLATLIYNTEQVAKDMMDRADNTGLAIGLAHGVSPTKLTDVSAREIDKARPADEAEPPAVKPQPVPRTDDDAEPEQESPKHAGPGGRSDEPSWMLQAVLAWRKAIEEGRDGLTNAELAEAAGKSVATVKRKKDAIQRLAKLPDGRHAEDAVAV